MADLQLVGGCLFVMNEWGKWGVLNKAGRELLPCIYDRIVDASEGFAVCVDTGVYQYVNLSKPRRQYGNFKKAQRFSQSMAPVMNDVGKWGYIDTSGTVVIPYKYDKIDSFKKDVAAVAIGKYSYLINKKGATLRRFRNKTIYNFQNGLIHIDNKKNDNEGLFNNRGKKLLRCKYFSVSDYPEKGFLVATSKGGHRDNDLLIIDTNGHVVSTGAYSHCDGLESAHGSGFSDGRLGVGKYENGFKGNRHRYSERACLWGYVNKRGEEVIPCKFDEVGPFKNGFARVRWQGHNRYIDTNGNFVRMPTTEGVYGYVGVFMAGMAMVQNEGDYWGFIDTSGKLVVDCDFEDVKNFSDGLAPVSVEGKWGYVNQNGSCAIKPQFESADTFVQGVAAVELGGYYRFINKSGDFINERKYSRVQFCTGAFWLVERSNKGFLVDRQGNEILVFTRNKKRKVGYFDSHDLVEIDSFVYSIDSWGMSKLTFVCDTNKIRPVYSFKDLCYTEGKKLKVDKDRGQKMEAIAASKQWGEGEIFEEMFVRVRVDDKHPYRGHRDTKTYKYGLIDTNGRLVTPVKFEEIQHFSDGMASVKLNAKWGYIDTSGRMVIKNAYKSANDFGCGVAAVELDGKWILINKKGEQIRQLGTKIETSYFLGW